MVHTWQHHLSKLTLVEDRRQEMRIVQAFPTPTGLLGQGDCSLPDDTSNP